MKLLKNLKKLYQSQELVLTATTMEKLTIYLNKKKILEQCHCLKLDDPEEKERMRRRNERINTGKK